MLRQPTDGNVPLDRAEECVDHPPARNAERAPARGESAGGEDARARSDLDQSLFDKLLIRRENGAGVRAELVTHLSNAGQPVPVLELARM